MKEENEEPKSENTAAEAVASVSNKRKNGDPYLWGIYVILCLISLVVTYDAAGREIHGSNVYGPLIKQVIFLLTGGGIAYLIQRIDYKRFLKWIPVFCVFTLLALFYVEKFGEVINGAQRNISLLGFSLQPTELAKLGVVLGMAQIMARNQMENGVKWRGLIFCFILVGLFGIFLIKQGLTNTLLLMCTVLAMILVSGTQWRKIFMLVGSFAALIIVFIGIIAVVDFGDDATNTITDDNGVTISIEAPETEPVDPQASSFMMEALDYVEVKLSPKLPRLPTQLNRVRDFIDPTPMYKRPFNERNNQAMFAGMAQANGGWSGVGVGRSKYSNMLPLAFSDYVFSIIIEDTGLWGGIVVLLLYLFILARAGNIAQRCKRALPALMVIGLAFLIVSQALFHMAINTGVFPVSGQPLPLISMGGTSIIVISIAFGIMQSVCSSASTTDDSKAQDKAEVEALPDDLRAANDAN